jgi:hypothetical protein
MMNLVQGDCKCGALAFVAGENLSAATGLLVKLSSAGKAVKPVAVSDIAPYVVACGAFEGYLCGVVPLTSAANCRIVLKGACQAGALLVSAGDGRVESGAPSGSAVPVGVAEEAGVDGQRVLLRPLQSAGAAGVQGPQGPQGPQGVQGAAGPAGFGLVVDALTGALSGGTGATASGAGATAFGAGGAAGTADACAYGHSAAVTGDGGVAVGAYSYALYARGVALGNSTWAMAEGRVELASGYPAYSYGRISVQQNGAAMFSVAPTAAPDAYEYKDFGNPDGALPAGMWTASLNGDGTALVFYVNVAGVVKSGSVALA